VSSRTSAYVLGVTALVALVYAVLAEPFGFSWGLIVVGLVGGAGIGYLLQGSGRVTLAVALAVVAWLCGLAGAYVLSQVLYQGATTPLTSRLSLGGLWEYAQIAFLPRAIALVATVIAAWRSAR
jgi:hypothetical protein